MINTDIETLRDVLLDTLNAAYPNLLILVDNQVEEQTPLDAVYCRFSVKPNTKNIVQIGSTKLYEQLGMAFLQIIIPPQQGDAIGYDIAQTFDNVIKGWRSSDKAMTVYQTGYQTFSPTDKEPNMIINHVTYWKSRRA